MAVGGMERATVAAARAKEEEEMAMAEVAGSVYADCGCADGGYVDCAGDAYEDRESETQTGACPTPPAPRQAQSDRVCRPAWHRPEALLFLLSSPHSDEDAFQQRGCL